MLTVSSFFTSGFRGPLLILRIIRNTKNAIPKVPNKRTTHAKASDPLQAIVHDNDASRERRATATTIVITINNTLFSEPSRFCFLIFFLIDLNSFFDSFSPDGFDLIISLKLELFDKLTATVSPEKGKTGLELLI